MRVVLLLHRGYGLLNSLRVELAVKLIHAIPNSWRSRCYTVYLHVFPEAPAIRCCNYAIDLGPAMSVLHVL